MTIMDSKLHLADGEAAFGTAATRHEGNELDMDTIGRRLGSSQNLALVIRVGTAFASGGSATVQFQLVSDSTTTIAVDGSATIHYASRVYAYTELVAGANIVIPLPSGIPNAERYLGLLVVTAGATTTAGAIDAFIALQDADDWVAYPDAVN